MDAFTVPVFESIDANGVDLSTGMLRLRSPSVSVGSGDELVSTGLEWIGRSWRLVNFPTINRDGSEYFVSYKGVTRKFKSKNDNYKQQKPVDGSTLECRGWADYDFASECIFIDRYGDVVVFNGLYSPLTLVPDRFGMARAALGNMGMYSARVLSATSASSYNIDDYTYNYKSKYFDMAGQQLRIVTPNMDGTDDDEQYLRPKNVSQQIIDDFGSIWTYTVNSDRELTKISFPGGLSSIEYTYDSSHRVKTVKYVNGGVGCSANANCEWDYDYFTTDDYLVTTVTPPAGARYQVKSHKSRGYVVEYISGFLSGDAKITSYEYDDDYRLETITYPEENTLSFEYDDRGNVVKRIETEKPTSDGAVRKRIISTAIYDTDCLDRILCNRPRYIVDANGGKTSFTYDDTKSGGIIIRFTANPEVEYYDYGHGRPVRIEYPELSPGGERRTVDLEYYRGRIAKNSECVHAGCGDDEKVVTEIGYASLRYWANIGGFGGNILATSSNRATAVGSNPPLEMDSYLRLPISEKVTADGKTLLSCMQYDEFGRLVGRTPPEAGLASCDSAFSSAPVYNSTLPSEGDAKTVPVLP